VILDVVVRVESMLFGGLLGFTLVVDEAFEPTVVANHVVGLAVDESGVDSFLVGLTLVIHCPWWG
jgi:hypothetical protein